MSCYTIHNQPATWQNAKNECEGKQMHLLVMETDEERAFITQLARDAGVWLGLFRL